MRWRVLTLKENDKVSVKCTLKGELPWIFLELKERGIVKSVREAMVQGLLAIYDRTMERDLKRTHVRASMRLEEEV